MTPIMTWTLPPNEFNDGRGTRLTSLNEQEMLVMKEGHGKVRVIRETTLFVYRYARVQQIN
jgi:hypothetical protein